MNPTTFPYPLVRAALILKRRELQESKHKGPCVGVVYSPKYSKPMLSFCNSPQSSTRRCVHEQAA